MRQSVNQHDKFFKQLEKSSDGFSTVAEYFGRGMFNAAPPKAAAAADGKGAASAAGGKKGGR